MNDPNWREVANRWWASPREACRDKAGRGRRPPAGRAHRATKRQ